MTYLNAATAAYQGLPEYDGFVVIDANGTPDQVAAEIRRQVPAPVVSRLPRLRPLLLTGGPLLAGVTALGYQVAEAF
jgi:dTMP kinase